MTLETYTLRTPVGAPPAAVYAALTDAAALEAWLAEHAEADTDRGIFEFWGRLTPAGERGRQRLLAAEPGRRLSFSWTLEETETTVDIALEAQDGGTLVTLAHSGVPPRASGDAYWVRDLLMLSLANLGGRYSFGWDHGPVKILELEPGKVLAYSWRHSWEDGQGPDSTVVRWELDGSQGRTHLTIVHSGFGTGGRRPDGYQVGWMEFLASLLAGQKTAGRPLGPKAIMELCSGMSSSSGPRLRCRR